MWQVLNPDETRRFQERSVVGGRGEGECIRSLFAVVELVKMVYSNYPEYMVQDPSGTLVN